MTVVSWIARNPTVRALAKAVLRTLPRSMIMRLPSRLINRTYFSGLRAISLAPVGRFFMIEDATSESLAATGFDGHGGEAIRCFIALLNGAKTFLDVGANTGVYSLVALSHGGIAVHAFEPVAFILERLKANAALNGFELQSHVVAVGAATGETTI